MISEKEALDMRAMIRSAGFDFRDVYADFGIEIETHATARQVSAVEKLVEERWAEVAETAGV